MCEKKCNRMKYVSLENRVFHGFEQVASTIKGMCFIKKFTIEKRDFKSKILLQYPILVQLFVPDFFLLHSKLLKLPPCKVIQTQKISKKRFFGNSKFWCNFLCLTFFYFIANFLNCPVVKLFKLKNSQKIVFLFFLEKIKKKNFICQNFVATFCARLFST